MLYLNKINQVTEAQRKLNLTLTSVVFEWNTLYKTKKWPKHLTLTSVVFESVNWMNIVRE